MDDHCNSVACGDLSIDDGIGQFGQLAQYPLSQNAPVISDDVLTTQNCMFENDNTRAGNTRETSRLAGAAGGTAKFAHHKRPFSDVIVSCHPASKCAKQTEGWLASYESTICLRSTLPATAEKCVTAREREAEHVRASPVLVLSFPSHFGDYVPSVGTDNTMSVVDSQPAKVGVDAPQAAELVDERDEFDRPFVHHQVDRRFPSEQRRCALEFACSYGAGAENAELEYPVLRPVPIGPNHQVNIPPCNSEAYKEDEGEKWIGQCIMPMPESCSDSTLTTVQYNSVCDCHDKGSVRCVRQHVSEARESLKGALGCGKFEDLGFLEMGECVAAKWTKEEEHLFSEVVLSNPKSLGKNFWDYLDLAFPTKSCAELVSYFYNVFMLRKRAEQNRYDPLNVDSDDDECQEGDCDEFAMTEEEDSVVESLVERKSEAGDGQSESDDVEDCIEYVAVSPASGPPCSDNALSAEHPDLFDDSCLTIEGQHTQSEYGDLPLKIEHDIAEVYAGGFFGDPCGTESWDIGLARGKPREEFLSTCSVIEEISLEPSDKVTKFFDWSS